MVGGSYEPPAFFFAGPRPKQGGIMWQLLFVIALVCLLVTKAY